MSKPKSSGKVKIEYFKHFYGRPAPLVFLMEHKGVKYEYDEIDQADWPQRKAQGKAGEFGGLPIVTRGRQEQ